MSEMSEHGSEHFETEVIVEPNEVSVTLPEVGIIGAGPTLDEAIEDTLEKLRLYARRYLDERSGRTEDTLKDSLLAKFMSTPQEQQRELLLGDTLWGALIARGLKSLEEGRVTLWDAATAERMREKLSSI